MSNPDRDADLKRALFQAETARERAHTDRICARLRDVIKVVGLSQREAATLAGTTQPTITGWTKHNVRPTLYSLARFVSFLGALFDLNGATASQRRALQALRSTILDVDQ